MSRRLLLSFLIFYWIGGSVACKGYKTKPRLEPEELQLAEMVAQLAEQSEQLSSDVPDSIRKDYDTYLESANKFNHAAQRYGPSSLRGRDAYDKMRFQVSQFDEKLRAAQLPDFLKKWEILQKDHIEKIGARLGYKIQPES